MKKIIACCLCFILLTGCGGKKVLADGLYTVQVTAAGGSGRAFLYSPAALNVENGSMTVTLVWSSSNYDYMIVDGVKYEPVTYEGGSTFQIPLKNLEAMKVIGDTVAMSTPHEVEYTLTFGEVGKP